MWRLVVDRIWSEIVGRTSSASQMGHNWCGICLCVFSLFLYLPENFTYLRGYHDIAVCVGKWQKTAWDARSAREREKKRNEVSKLKIYIKKRQAQTSFLGTNWAERTRKSDGKREHLVVITIWWSHAKHHHQRTVDLLFGILDIKGKSKLIKMKPTTKNETNWISKQFQTTCDRLFSFENDFC